MYVVTVLMPGAPTRRLVHSVAFVRGVEWVPHRGVHTGQGMTTVAYPELNAALLKAKVGVAAAELHGSITGYLCAGWGGQAQELLAALALESDAAAGELHALVDRVAADIAGSLRAGESVTPLLPQTSLAARTDAMVDWCRGFLGGVGLTGLTADPRHESEVRALLGDFGHIASTHLECDDDDEEALGDVLDFIRAGVARLHALLAPVGRQ